MSPRRDLQRFIERTIPGVKSMAETDFQQVFVAFVSILFSITIHEFGHAWMADRLGDPTPRRHGRVTINPMVLIKAEPFGTVIIPALGAFTGFLFGFASTPVNPSLVRSGISVRRAEFLISIAGPVSNIGLFVICSLIYVGLLRYGGSSSEPFIHLAQILILVNGILAIFNLVPIPPLDGFSVAQALFPNSSLLERLAEYGNLIFIIFFLSAGRLFTPVLSAFYDWIRWLGTV